VPVDLIMAVRASRLSAASWPAVTQRGRRPQFRTQDSGFQTDEPRTSKAPPADIFSNLLGHYTRAYYGRLVNTFLLAVGFLNDSQAAGI
jgi:hypothetical protein